MGGVGGDQTTGIEVVADRLFLALVLVEVFLAGFLLVVVCGAVCGRLLLGLTTELLQALTVFTAANSVGEFKAWLGTMGQTKEQQARQAQARDIPQYVHVSRRLAGKQLFVQVNKIYISGRGGGFKGGGRGGKLSFAGLCFRTFQ